LTHILVQRLELPPSLTAVQPAHSSYSHYSSVSDDCEMNLVSV